MDRISTIATFRSPFSTKFGVPRQSGLVEDLPGEIHFEPEFKSADALRGLEEFDYLWLIWEFSANVRRDAKVERSWTPTVRPPRLGGNVQMGVFATRSPFRPNPIGLSSVRIERVDFEKAVIYVKGADLMDGTPILDIKPYVSYTDSHPDASCGFVDSSQWRTLEVSIPENLSSLLTSEERVCLEKTLSLDPRPHYKADSDRVYGFVFSGRDIRFTVSDGVATVVDIVSL